MSASRQKQSKRDEVSFKQQKSLSVCLTVFIRPFDAKWKPTSARRSMFLHGPDTLAKHLPELSSLSNQVRLYRYSPILPLLKLLS